MTQVREKTRTEVGRNQVMTLKTRDTHLRLVLTACKTVDLSLTTIGCTFRSNQKTSDDSDILRMIPIFSHQQLYAYVFLTVSSFINAHINRSRRPAFSQIRLCQVKLQNVLCFEAKPVGELGIVIPWLFAIRILIGTCFKRGTYRQIDVVSRRTCRFVFWLSKYSKTKGWFRRVRTRRRRNYVTHTHIYIPPMFPRGWQYGWGFNILLTCF